MMDNTLKILIFIIAIPLFLSACSKDEETSDSYESVQQKRIEKMAEAEKKKFLESQKKPLAIVNGKKIFEGDLENGDLNQTITNEVLYQVAVDRGIDKEVKPQVDNYERNLVLNKIKEQIRSDIHPEVTEEEISSYYKDHKDEYTLVEIEEIATSKEDLAYDVRREALKGTEFKSIPALFNTDNTVNVTYRSNSSIVGIFFSDAIKIGQVSQVIGSDDEFIVQKVVSKREPNYEELRDIISISLLKEKTQNSYSDKIEALKKEKKVEILAEAPSKEESPK